MKRKDPKYNPTTKKATFSQGIPPIDIRSDAVEKHRNNYGSDFTIDRTKKNKSSPKK